MAAIQKWYYYIPIFIVLPLVNLQSTNICPPQEAILPCRCLLRGLEIQLWCTHSNLPNVLEALRTVGLYLKKPIDELILENNNLPSLPGKAFTSLKVMRLMLRFNGLERVSSDWLSGLEPSLMELFIVEPELRSLPEDSLERIELLEAITIQSNLLKRLPRFSGLLKLRYLRIESLSLVEMTERHYKALPSLEKLHVSGSPRLTRLEGNLLQDLPKLSLVNISFCGILWIHPRAITHLPSLTELWLVGNKITDAAIVGRSIRDLPVLEVLRLDYNHIDQLNEAAFVDLPSLKKLYMPNNKITELHHGSFHRVPKLRFLNLNNNMVQKVHPESFLQHSSSGLEELWVVNNEIAHISELQALFDTLPRLIFLDVSYNKLEAIPFGALRGHATLERLHLDHNKIGSIDREAFMAMPALRELHLRNNTLSDVLDSPFWNLPALKGLDLSYNFFRRLEPKLLTNLPSLRKIDLSNNKLEMIDPTSFLGNLDLEYVNVSNNVLTAIHPATFRPLLQLYEVDVTFNKIIEFVPGLPRGLEYLHLAGNQIHTLPLLPSPDLDLPSLRMLDLTGNNIKKIETSGFSSLPQLRKLYIAKNMLEQLDNAALKGLKRLEILDVRANTLLRIVKGALSETTELREIYLSQNRLSTLPSELLQDINHLKILDLSENEIVEIAESVFDSSRNLRVLDLSKNALANLPSSIQALENLRVLDLSNNRFHHVNQKMLNSLTSLSELYLSQNLLRELPKHTFNNMPQLKMLHLDHNQIEIIESLALNTLPLLQILKLNNNKLKEIPNRAFNNLSSLQVAELQENRLKNIENYAFLGINHLLVLNISNNQLPGLEEAGLKSLESLEVLDIRKNAISHVTTNSLEKMEWLVELRLDDNQICSVDGSEFNGMPRLRVLSMKNNKMATFPEKSIRELRENLALLDIDGNPLTCSCSILWFKAWLQESSSEGPRCMDGTLLREMRLSRQDCSETARLPEPYVAGCESARLSATVPHKTLQVSSLGNYISKQNSSGALNNHLAPTPEESDYFYDEYVDYPFTNDTMLASHMFGNDTPPTIQQKPVSSHYIPGDTPTIYASTTKSIVKASNSTMPKTASSSPSSSGFTFFGVPLPNFNLNLNGLISRGNGRMAQDKIAVQHQSAERKSAIVNNSPHVVPKNMYRYPPIMPDIETGGFVPLLPGAGGFKPMQSTHLITETNAKTESTTYSTQNYYNTPTVALISIPTTVQSAIDVITEKPSTKLPISTDNPSPTTTELVEIQKAEVIEIIPTTSKQTSTPFPANTRQTVFHTSPTTEHSQVVEFVETTTEFFDNTAPEAINYTDSPQTMFPVSFDNTQTVPSTLPPSPQKPQGKPVITRVHSPHVSGSAPLLAVENDIFSNAPLQLPQNLAAKVYYDVPTTQKIDTKHQDMSWYYTNYNKTKVEPYVGVSKTVIYNCSGCSIKTSVSLIFLLVKLTLILYII